MTGLLLGVTVAVFIAAFILNFSTETPLLWVLIAALIITGGIAGCMIEGEVSSSFVVEYQAAKVVYEDSMNNEALGGLERMELLEQVVELSRELASYQHQARQWYGFNIDDAVLELEPITLTIRNTTEEATP